MWHVGQRARTMASAASAATLALTGCLTQTSEVYEFVQAGNAGTLPANSVYVLSAPLSGPVGTQTLQTQLTADLAGATGLTRPLQLVGASAFHVRVDASFASESGSNMAYVSVGLSASDEIVDTVYGGGVDQLPAGALSFNYSSPSATGTSGANAQAFTVAIVPPGKYYVSSLGFPRLGSNAAPVFGTLSIAATPIFDNLGVSLSNQSNALGATGPWTALALL